MSHADVYGQDSQYDDDASASFDPPAWASPGEVLGVDAVADASSAADVPSAGRASRGHRGVVLTRASARGAIAKYLEVVAAPDDVREMAGTLLGASKRQREDAAELAVAALTGDHGEMIRVARGLADWGDADAMEVMGAVMDFEDGERQLAWRLLVAAGVVEGRLPGKLSTAAMEIARAVLGAGEALQRIGRAARLAQK